MSGLILLRRVVHRKSIGMAKRNFNEVVILSAARTPIGSFRGALKPKSAVELGVIAAKSAIERAGLTPNQIEEVYWGNCIDTGLGQAPSRQVTLGAGCPVTTEATAVNKACASSLKAVTIAAQSLRLGDRNIMLAGGMESMSNVPFMLPREEPKYGGQVLLDLLTDGLTCSFNKIHMGACTEKLLSKFGITREEQDAYAIRSYNRSTKAWSDGIFSNEVVPVEVKDPKTRNTTTVSVDEEFSRFKAEKFPTLRSVFVADGTITAGNASKLNDGASAVTLATLDAANLHNLKPLAKIISYADGACEPVDFGFAPAISIKKALELAGLKASDISLFEINEAFSAVPLIVIKELSLNPELVNVHGGAVSLGHPVGASGCRILGHLVHVLKSGEYGVAGICNGGGGSTSVVIQKL